jgi:hypothetical protein
MCARGGEGRVFCRYSELIRGGIKIVAESNKDNEDRVIAILTKLYKSDNK